MIEADEVGTEVYGLPSDPETLARFIDCKKNKDSGMVYA